MRLDCAAGFGDPGRFAYGWTQGHMRREFSPEDLWRILSRNRFEGIVARAITDSPDETEWLLEIQRSHPWVRGVIGNRAVEGVCGVQCGVAGLDDAGRLGLPCDLVVSPRELAGLAGRVDGMRAALVNMGGARYAADEFAGWASAMEELAGVPSVVVKTSGFLNEAPPDAWSAATYRPYVQHVLRCFGPERVMWGSDWPNCMVTSTWKESLAAFTQAMGAQTMETREMILGGNAARFYGLG